MFARRDRHGQGRERLVVRLERNVEDSTAALQAAFDSGASRVVIDRQVGDWISRPLFITNSNIEVLLADGVRRCRRRSDGGYAGASLHRSE